MSDHYTPRLALVRAAACCLAAIVPVTGALAEGAAPSLAQRPADPLNLKHLPGSHELLTFRGESSSASWPVFLNRSEAAQITTFQMGLLNTVSLLPERSFLRLSVNGRPVATMQIKSPDRMALIPIRIPAGVLVPGFNEVQASVTMVHRVDCSVKATFELWAMLDPAQTGFVVPRLAASAGKSLDELAGEPLADDGTAHVHLRLPDDADAATLGRAADLVSVLAARAHLVRPIVDIGPEPGTGAGFDVTLGAPPTGGRDVGHDTGLGLARDPSTGRLTVAADASDPVQFDGSIAALRQAADHAAEGTSQGVRALALQSGFPVEEGRRLSFAELGFRNEAFAGRHLQRTVGLTLPTDFYPGNYGTVRVYVDGDRAGGLSGDSTLVFRVNGALVSSLPLGSGSSDRFDHAMVDLPLQFFRPGYNAIALEGTTVAAADEQCALSTAAAAPRLTIADTSEIVMPHLARMQTAPQIAARLSSDRDSQIPGLDLYFTGADRAALGIGMTIAANIAARDGVGGPVRFNLDQPVSTDRPGIVIGPLASLPEMLTKQVHRHVVMQDARPVTALAASPSPSTAGSSADATPAAPKPDSAPPYPPSVRDPSRLLQTAFDGGKQWLRNKGFFFGEAEGTSTLALGDQSLLVSDVTTHEVNRTLFGVDLPRFSETSDRWLVITGTSTDSMASATESLIANDRWKDLAGETASYDPGSNQLSRIDAARSSYVIPRTVALTDVQPILGGILSNNIVASVAVLLLLLSLLGLSTHAVLTFVGVRSR